MQRPTISMNLYKKFKASLTAIGLLLMLNLISMSVFAQDPGLPGGNDADAPIDGGLSLLVAAGIGYGAKKLSNKKNI